MDTGVNPKPGIRIRFKCSAVGHHSPALGTVDSAGPSSPRDQSGALLISSTSLEVEGEVYKMSTIWV